MKDSDFKNAGHIFPKTHRIATRGRRVQNSYGYKPDLTIEDANGKLSFILESEQKTDRKAFLGDILKANVYAEEKKSSPELIIIMQTFRNTTVCQICQHLIPYVNWLHKHPSKLWLSKIFILSDEDYKNSISAKEELGSISFQNRCCRIF